MKVVVSKISHSNGRDLMFRHCLKASEAFVKEDSVIGNQIDDRLRGMTEPRMPYEVERRRNKLDFRRGRTPN